MTAAVRRAVLTGIGLITPIGLDANSFWESLRLRRSGVRPIEAFDASAFPVRFGGEVTGFDARNYLDKKARKQLKVMVRGVQFAVAASQLALDDAGIDKERLAPERFGVVFGVGTVPSELVELGQAAVLSTDECGTVNLARWGAQGLPEIPPMWLLNHVPNMLACHVSILHNAQGPNNSITQTDVAGLLALGEAFRTIRRGRADIFLTGGADDKINPITLARQCLFSPLSRRNDAPEKACRPFARDRDGIVLGEGGGVLVLEELGHARRRGARIYAEVVGFGAAFDGDRTGRGLARAIRAALKDAAIGPEDLDHVNAHGYSTVEGDIWEARGLRDVFGAGSSSLPVLAAKSYFGNLGSAGGPTELAASLLACAHGDVPPTLNYECPDPQCPANVITGPRAMTRPYFLKISLTEVGQCAALVCRKLE